MKRGFSLIEVLVFISVASVFFITAISVGTYTLKNMKQDEYKLRATRYAEELNEWLRGEKEKDWDVFYGYANNNTYCFNSTSLSFPAVPGNNPCSANDFSLEGLFKRSMILSQSGNKVITKINVSWNEGGNTFTVPLNTVYSLYQ